MPAGSELVNEGGTWTASDCTEVDAQCRPGTEETEACGNCGMHARRCTGECRWGDWQPCNDVGECIPGSRDEENVNSCEFSGRICNDMCTWETDCSQVGPSGCDQPGEEQVEPVEIVVCGDESAQIVAGGQSGVPASLKGL